MYYCLNCGESYSKIKQRHINVQFLTFECINCHFIEAPRKINFTDDNNNKCVECNEIVKLRNIRIYDCEHWVCVNCYIDHNVKKICSECGKKSESISKILNDIHIDILCYVEYKMFDFKQNRIFEVLL